MLTDLIDRKLDRVDSLEGLHRLLLQSHGSSTFVPLGEASACIALVLVDALAI